jgi:outer membrane protein
VDLLTAKAALFPSLSFSTSHNVVNRPFQETSSYVSGSEILQNSGKTSYNGNYGLNAQWTLYNGGKRLNTIKQEKLNSKAAELDVETSANSIQESILQNYVQILYAAESIKVNESTLEVSKAQYERGKQLVAAGSLSRVDLAQLEAQVSTDEYQLVMAQTQLQNYKLQLKQLLELDGADEMNVQIVDIDDARVLATLPDKLDVYEAALAQRPEIQSGKLNIESAALGVKVAKAGYIPTVALTAGIGTNHTTGSDYTFTEQVKNGWNNTAGLSVSVPIFNNRQTKSAVQKAKLQQETSQLDLLDKQKALYKSIEGYWLDAINSQQRYAAAEKKQESAQTSYELISQQFDLGMKNIVELLTEKNTLLSARQETLQAKYMAVLNAQLLKFYQGEKVEL